MAKGVSPKEKIYLDVTPYFWRTEDKGGIYHYIERFLAHLTPTQKKKIVLFLRGRRVIDAHKVEQFRSTWPIKWVKLPGQLHHLFPVLCKRGKFLSFWDDVPCLLGLKSFSVIHDLRAVFYEDELKSLEEGLPLYPLFSRLPAYHQRRRYFAERKKVLLRTLKRAQGFIAISDFTADQLKRVGVPASNIKKVYHGPLPQTQKAPLPSFLKSRGFLLYVGKIEPLKNVEGLLLAFEELRKDFPDLSLVLAGPLTWYGRFLKSRWSKLENVYFLDLVSPQVLETLYQEALCLVLPSFYEGFGLPVLEAMSRGLPVAASRRGAIPEVGGEAGLYFDPTNPKAIRDTLARLCANPPLRNDLAQKGVARSKFFSWERCVQETLDWLEEN